jgi:predicted type IV restriction endonuclease
MSAFPKKFTERVAGSISKFQKVLQIARDRDVNESDTVAIINDILGDVLGYEKYLEVTSEFSIRGTYCDLALKVDGKVEFLVEAKAVGIELKDSHMKQACDYGANLGVPWIILTNGITWRVYRIRFEQPINYDFVFTFNFLDVSVRSEKDLEFLFALSREGLSKNAREILFDKFQCVNRFVIGQLMLSEPVLTVLRRELKRFAEGVKIESAEMEQVLKTEVIKREIFDGDESQAAAVKLRKFYKKSNAATKPQPESPPAAVPAAEESVTDRLLREANDA